MGNALPPITCSRVEFSATMVREIDGQRILATIPREHIRQISLSYDSKSAHPFLHFLLGFTMLSLGIIGVTVSFFANPGGGFPLSVGAEDEVRIHLIPLACWLMTGLGLWCLIEICKVSYCLTVETEKGIRKIRLRQSPDPQEMRRIIRKASWSFGYQIDTSVLDGHSESELGEGD